MAFEITTTAQVERTYVVQTDEGLKGEEAEEQARKRLRTFIADPAMLREGLVIEQADKQVDTTPQKIKDATEQKPPVAAVPDAPVEPVEAAAGKKPGAKAS